jgi:superfamily II DNA or RNA helicase/HKD family nuclease
MHLPHGLYDRLLTAEVKQLLQEAAPSVADVRELNADESAERLADLVRDVLRRILAGAEGANPERLSAQLALVNGLLTDLRSRANGFNIETEQVSPPATVLESVRPSVAPPPELPETGLASPWLFTAGRASPALVTELRREAAACDRIDVLVSFITVAGVRKLIDVFRAVTAADATGEARTRIRVLTTTYTGATEIRALDQLARLNGCEVRISLDGRRTRLHAKAWIFHRATGFGSAYVGSANLSGAALMGGLEWTVKFTERGQEALFSRAKAHFDTLWLDEEFTLYDPEDAASRSAVTAALRQESFGSDEPSVAFFDIQPKPFQREMLAELEQEREHGRTRNLVVAATGTGKTVIAALDYRATCQKLGHRPRLLFVAHRAQILRQALRTYREVLRDHSFGELLTGGLQPEHHDHLFATIDSLTSRQLVDGLGPDYWHTVVIDECHRLAANRFRQLASTIRPALLLGLTATPERADGLSIKEFFTSRPDLSPAVELRLWDALDMQLVAPFEYFACDDDTDLSDVPWDKPGESAAIEARVVNNAARTRMVINEWRRLAADPRRGKALVFCVSVEHAKYTAEQFTAAGLPAIPVTGDTPRREQLRAPLRLARGEVCALVTVDLYNEGVDIPDVDTLLLLRPTQSPTLFQQQIGRGLRLMPGKESCLILDFVGQHRVDFRFDRLLSAITGLSRNRLIDSVEYGFTDLAPGCHIHLQRQTREQVLRSLRSLTNQNWRRLVAEVQSFSALQRGRAVPLGEFLTEQRVDLGEVYRPSGRSGWTTLRRDAGLLHGEGDEVEAKLSRRLGALLHVDDTDYLEQIRVFGEARGTLNPTNDRDALVAQMLTYQVLGGPNAVGFQVLRERFASYPNCAEELVQLADILSTRSRLDPLPLPGAEDLPLHLHAAYQTREILTAFGFLTSERYVPFQAGVLALPARRTELLFVTLDKSAGFHDRIAYHDYAVSPTRFHWQTQNSAGPHTPAGRRYIESAANGWQFQLFTRSRQGDPYRSCGPVYLADPADVTGNQPMSITWTLRVPLPPRLFSEFSVLRG